LSLAITGPQLKVPDEVGVKDGGGVGGGKGWRSVVA